MFAHDAKNVRHVEIWHDTFGIDAFTDEEFDDIDRKIKERALVLGLVLKINLSALVNTRIIFLLRHLIEKSTPISLRL